MKKRLVGILGIGTTALVLGGVGTQVAAHADQQKAATSQDTTILGLSPEQIKALPADKAAIVEGYANRSQVPPAPKSYDPPPYESPGTVRMDTGIFQANLNTKQNFQFAVSNSWVGYASDGTGEIVTSGAIADNSPQGIVLVRTFDPKTDLDTGETVIKVPGDGGALVINKDNGDNTLDLTDSTGQNYILVVGTDVLTPQ